MPYPAKAIANYFLDLAKRSGKTLSPMQIQKLVYFAHGWNLAIKGEPLIIERIEAWNYGPVIRSLYDEFKKYGSGPIERPAVEVDFGPGKWFAYGWDVDTQVPTIYDNPDAEENQFTEKLLKRIWETYGSFTAAQLSNLTHEADSPWTQARSNAGHRPSVAIQDDLIRDYFTKLGARNDAGRAEARISDH